MGLITAAGLTACGAPDLLSVDVPGELMEVLRIRPAPADGSLAGRAHGGDAVGTDLAEATPDHPLWGEWRIIGHVIPGVSAMSESRASAWTGRAVEYTRLFARSPNGECVEPGYSDRNESVDALMSGEFGVPASSLPPVADLEAVDVVDVRCAGSGWRAAGESVMLLDRRRALTPWDAVFFELRRTR